VTIPYVEATGSPYELGFAHGRERGAALRAFLADGLCRLDRILPAPVDRAGLGRLLEDNDEAITVATPDLGAELWGLADGAGISRAEAVLLQVRREIMGYQRIPTAGDCTTYARPGDVPVLAQTVDLNGDLDDHIAVLRLGRSLVLSFGGLLGYLGLNDAGLAVGLNLVLGGRWRPGLPPYLAIRHVLDTADSVDDAVKILGDLRLASSRSIMLCDPAQAGYVEILGDESRFQPLPPAIHTNHFLDPGFAAQDELNVFARNSSLRRLDACRAALAEVPADADAERHFGVLTRPPICVGDSGDLRRERTVAAIVAFPTRGELHVRPGDPSRSDTEVFRCR
jgi:isopenicillin-N N-acyltransferase-like protein